MKRNKMVATGAICGLVAAMTIGGTMAYLTDSEQTSNTFTVGKVKIDLEEPKWDTTDDNNNKVPDVAEKLVPNQEVAKNPQVENTGSNNAVVFMKVTVPTKFVTKVSDDGTVDPEGRKSQEIIYFKNARDAQSKEEPGMIVEVNKKEIIVATGSNDLALHEIQLAGKKRMQVQAFLLGYQVEAGMKLGE